MGMTPQMPPANPGLRWEPSPDRGASISMSAMSGSLPEYPRAPLLGLIVPNDP